MKTAVIVGLAVTLLLGGCGSNPTQRYYKYKQDHGPADIVDVSLVPDAVPKIEKRTRAGNPKSYTVLGKTYFVLADERDYKSKGTASWYGNKFHGEKTSNGEIYDMYAMTAAHKTLPIPSYVRVTNLKNGRQVIVRVNDRGPFHDGRIIDLSYAAASKLGYLGQGTARVRVEAIDPRQSVTAVAVGSSEHQAEVARQKATTIDHSIYVLPPKTYLQVGAFGVLNSANSLLARLEDVTTLPVVIRSNGGLYRVRIGPINDQRDMTILRERLQKKNIANPHVVHE